MKTNIIYIDKEYAWGITKGIDPREVIAWHEPPIGVLHTLSEIINTISAWSAEVIGEFLAVHHIGFSYATDVAMLKNVILGRYQKTA